MQLRKPISKETAQQRLETLCVAAEHCRFELEEKLRRWGLPADEREEVLATLEKARFFDDARFAKAYVRDKVVYNRWGRQKVSMGLYAKRIDRSLIDEAFDELDPEDYEDAALRYLEAKARSVKEGFTYEGRTKLYRSGISRGFESALVARLVKNPKIWGIDPDEA